MNVRVLGRFLLLGFALVLALGTTACAGEPSVGQQLDSSASETAESAESADPNELTIAIAGMVTPDEGLDYYLELSEYVGRKVGKPVRLIHKADYGQVNEMLKEGKVDVAFVCSGPYVAAHDEFDLQLLCAPVVNGQPAYNSYIIVNSSSDATSWASLRGSRFAFTDPESNTGHTVPLFMLDELGEDPETFFGRTFYTYSHDNSIKAVATGEADAAAVDSLVWEYGNATSPQYTSKTRILLKSEPYAIPPVVIRPGLDAKLVGRLRDAFLTAKDDARGRAILEKMRIEEFVVIEDSAYDVIREMNEKLGK